VVIISTTFKMKNIEIFQELIRDTRKRMHNEIYELDIFYFIQYELLVQDDTNTNNTITGVRDFSLFGILSLSQITYYSHYLFFHLLDGGLHLLLHTA
jgi:hypothetical protein